jgi:putative DNA primase/helicase
MTDFAELMEPVGRRLLGEPNRNLSNERELRWGTHGSFCVDLQKGVWSDHEIGKGGGVLDLIERETGLKGAERLRWLERAGFFSAPRARSYNEGSNGAVRTRVVATPRCGDL